MLLLIYIYIYIIFMLYLPLLSLVCFPVHILFVAIFVTKMGRNILNLSKNNGNFLRQ